MAPRSARASAHRSRARRTAASCSARALHRRHQRPGPGCTPCSCARRTRTRASSSRPDRRRRAPRPACWPCSPATTGARTKIGGIPCGWQIKNKDGTPMVGAAAPGAGAGPGPPRRRPGRGGGRRDHRPGARGAARLVEVDYDELPAVGRRSPTRSPPGAPLVWDQAPGNVCYDWHLGDAAATDAAFAKATHVVELDLVNNRVVPERDGAARRQRRLRPRHRRLHALHHQPEPAPDPAAARRLQLRHPGAQAARGRARRRRRLRVEDLPLRRGVHRGVGGAEARPAGQVDGGAHRSRSSPTRTAAIT